MVDIKAIHARTSAALREAGPYPWLVGYDVNGIQELVAANGRPIAMRGTSDTITRFDEKQAKDPCTIFAGGGRGVRLARYGNEAKALSPQLADEFYRDTCGGVLAGAAVRYEATAPRASLLWLRRS